MDENKTRTRRGRIGWKWGIEDHTDEMKERTQGGDRGDDRRRRRTQIHENSGGKGELQRWGQPGRPMKEPRSGESIARDTPSLSYIR